MIVLGISDMSQDSSACVLREGQIVAAVSEERVRGEKHCGGFPSLAIRECLRIAGISPCEVEHVAVGNTSSTSAMRGLTHILGVRRVPEPVPHGPAGMTAHALFHAYRAVVSRSPLRRADRTLSQGIVRASLIRMGIGAPVEFFDHHLSHAASAFYTSGLRKSLVLSLDAYGDGRSGALFVGRGKEIEEISSFSPEVSLGEFYGAVTSLLGYRFGSDEGVVMALAALGRPILKEKLQEHISVNGLTLTGDLSKYGRFTARRLSPLAKRSPADLAASAQALLEETVCEMVLNALEETGARKLCFAGGVALNVKLNQRLMSLPKVKDFHVFPAAGDDGTAVGAALLLSRDILQNERMDSAALGTSHSRGEIMSAASGKGLFISDYEPHRIAAAISQGSLVGWFDGSMEFGPRALGRRSLLADARSPMSPERIRCCVKKRPSFQPFCPSLTPGLAREFLINPKGIKAPFMTAAFDTAAGIREKIPAVVHVDGSCRPQVVVKRENRRYHELLQAIGDVSGVECVLNTSLNRSGEPIVRCPEQALGLLFGTDMELLVLGDLVVSKERA